MYFFRTENATLFCQTCQVHLPVNELFFHLALSLESWPVFSHLIKVNIGIAMYEKILPLT